MRENIRRLMDVEEPEMRQRRNKQNGRYMGMEDYSGRHGRQIGYGASDTYDRRSTMRPERRMAMDDAFDTERYNRRNEMTMGRSGASQRMETGMGDITEYMEEPLTIDEAMEWVETAGARFDAEEVKKTAAELGIQTKGAEFAEFFAVINALYSDYHKVAKERGVDDLDFYGKMAKAFIDDQDAAENKSAIYYRFIVCPE